MIVLGDDYQPPYKTLIETARNQMLEAIKREMSPRGITASIPWEYAHPNSTPFSIRIPMKRGGAYILIENVANHVLLDKTEQCANEVIGAFFAEMKNLVIKPEDIK